MLRHSFNALNSAFTIDADYEFVQELGQGVSGFVVAVRHRKSGERCAIKKITNINTKFKLTKQCLREIKLLHHFRGHQYINCVYDMDIVFQPNGSFDEVYLYVELMEADLHAVIRSGQPLTDDHFQSLIHQTLCGLKYIHSANVLHRDIKPGNLLVNSDCQLKICDFGLARGYMPGGGTSKSGESAGFMTEYIAMRWYRAPETLCSFANYTAAIDVWSAGCVLAELLGGKPIFQGRSYVDQLNQILHYLGTPSEDALSRVGSPIAQEYIRSLPFKHRVSFTSTYPEANPLAIDLLSQMLCFDPAERTSCEQALNHPYLQVWHDPTEEPVCEKKFDSSFEEEDTIIGIKRLLVEEVRSFRKEVRALARESEQIHALDGPPSPTSCRDETISSPVRDGGDAPEPTSSSTMPTQRPSTPVKDDSSTTTQQSLSAASTSTTHGSILPHIAVTTSIHPEATMLPIPDPQESLSRVQPSTLVPGAFNSAPEFGPVHAAVSQSHNLTLVASGQTVTDSSVAYPVTNTLQNDLTDQITRDGHDPVASGGFADIYRAMLHESGEPIKVAVKAIKMYSEEESDFAKKHKRLRREIKVWLDLRHDNVLPLLGTTMGFGRFPAMVCPWAENGTLTSYVEERHDTLSAVEILGLLNSVASGLQYLHSCSVVHGDLSGSNVLIRGNGTACIADFGLSMLLTELGRSTFATSFHARGTLRWTAPEMLDLEVPEDGMEEEFSRVGPTMQSDVYSFGSVMLQILTGKVPYHYYTRDIQIIHAVSKGIMPRRPSTTLVTERRWMFMEHCWSANGVRSRPSSAEIVEFTKGELAGASAS